MSNYNYLAHLMNRLRDSVGSPHEAYFKVENPKPGALWFKPNVGFVGHDYATYSGHRVFEIINDAGGERNLAEGMKMQAVIKFVEGMLTGLEGKVKRYGTVS